MGRDSKMATLLKRRSDSPNFSAEDEDASTIFSAERGNDSPNFSAERKGSPSFSAERSASPIRTNMAAIIALT